MERRRPPQGPVRERGQTERQEREQTARRRTGAVQGGVREQEVASGVEGPPALGGQGAQGQPRREV
ncbi:hypothetical protein ADK59_16970 [Streptomyces sp. XY332]|nr:hypothetical protein ADK59_16970 [Streptomyces sp. XY332]